MRTYQVGDLLIDQDGTEYYVLTIWVVLVVIDTTLTLEAHGVEPFHIDPDEVRSMEHVLGAGTIDSLENAQ